MEYLLLFMKKWLLLLVLLTSGCNLVGFGVDEPYTFEKGFNEMLGLDEKYGADFYNEALDVETKPVVEVKRYARISDFRDYMLFVLLIMISVILGIIGYKTGKESL